MSYLNRLRLAFTGSFQADVSTVNNDVRHFDNASFQPAYQDPQAGQSRKVWNPNGSGAFRLIDCRVRAVWYADGTTTADSSEDPVVGMWIGGSSGRTSGKLVDVDPQWQLASALWGLELRLTDRDTDLFEGQYQPAAFRDLWFNRLTGSSQDGAASSTFQSVLDDVRWAGDASARSRFASELQAASGEQLSVRLATFGYHGRASSPRFTLGTVVGTIGPQRRGDPASFVAGRRFTPRQGTSTGHGITYFSGLIDETSQTLLLDLANALQITDRQGTPADIGTLVVGILQDPGTAEGAEVSDEACAVVAEVPYREAGWLQASAGVFAAPLTSDQAAMAAEHPLALVVAERLTSGRLGLGGGVVAIRESPEGLVLSAEPAVHRIDAGQASSFRLHARCYGATLPGADVALSQVGPVAGQGGGPASDPNPPSAPIPDIGVPEDALSLPSRATTGPDGTAEVAVGSDPTGPRNPRGYLDGQIYLLDYRLEGQGEPVRHPFEFVVVHARDAVEPNDHPTWDDVKDIFVQYANLYPIMSRQLIDLADPAAVLRHRELLRLAFSADIADPNHMPVTRDLSEPKRQLVLRWLDQGVADDLPATGATDRGAPETAPPLSTTRQPPVTARGGDEEEPGSKSSFAAGFRHAMDESRRQ